MKTDQLKRNIFPFVIALSVSTVGLFADDVPPAEKVVPEKTSDDTTVESKDQRLVGAAPVEKKEADKDLDRQLLRDLLPNLPIELEPTENTPDYEKTSSANGNRL